MGPTSAPLEVRGLPFLGENDGRWWRFPVAVKERVPDYVYETMKSPSGARVRLRTDSPCLWVRASYATPLAQIPSPNMHMHGAGGIDVYVDGRHLRTVIPSAQEMEEPLFQGLSRRPREVTVYAPLFAEATIRRVTLA
jgi:hypothetical protein